VIPEFKYFFLATSWFHSPITKKKLWRLSKIEGSVLKYRFHPLWRTYIGERRTTLAKTYGIRVRCYEENVGNTLGTKEKWIKKTILPSHPPRPPSSQRKKGKKARRLEWMLPIGCMAFLVPKEFVTTFGLG
jgi:hypothetical protein